MRARIDFLTMPCLSNSQAHSETAKHTAEQTDEQDYIKKSLAATEPTSRVSLGEGRNIPLFDHTYNAGCSKNHNAKIVLSARPVASARAGRTSARA